MVTKAEKKSHEDLMKISITSAKATYYLARRTILFGKNFNCDILSNMVNDDVLFIAALISRMYHAALVNQFEVSRLFIKISLVFLYKTSFRFPKKLVLCLELIRL